MALTWQGFLSSIPLRLNRDDLSQEFVEEMANEQITLFGPQLFVPSEITDFSIVTEPGQNVYKLAAGVQKVTYVRVLFNGIWVPVPQADTYQSILNVDQIQPPFTSPPLSLWRVYGNQIRFFPTANAQYPIELTEIATVPGPTDPADSGNFWTNDGNVFLRAATCLAICQEYLDQNNPQSTRIGIWQQRTTDALALLQVQVHAMSQPSVMRPYL